MHKKTDIISSKKSALVVGLGYVGFPLLREAALAKYRVYGFDTDRNKIEGYINGNSSEEFYDKHTIQDLITRNLVSFHDSLDGLDMAFDVVVICVPTPLSESGKPDLSHIKSSMDTVMRIYRPGTLVILESSSYPGTTRSLIYDRIIAESGGLYNVENTLVAYSPERIDPGNTEWNLINTPKLVAGLNAKSKSKAIDFYSEFIEKIVPVDKIEDAELAKLFENTFRLVNISLVNEFVSQLNIANCNPKAALMAAYSKPFGIMKFQPSPGIGGHCIPVDPVYLQNWAERLGARLSIVEAANTYSQSQAYQNLELITSVLGGDVKNRNILIVGVAYKPDVKDTRESPAFKILNLLQNKGAKVNWYDPLVPEVKSDRVTILGHWSGDAVVLVTRHSVFRENELRALAPEFIDLSHQW